MSQLGYAWAYGDIVLPAWRRLVRRRPLGERLAVLQRTQWLDAGVLARIQGEELRDLLVFAGANVPFYRELFAAARFDPRRVDSRDDLAALPLLTPETVRARYDDLVEPSQRGCNVPARAPDASADAFRFEHSAASETWRGATRQRAHGWAGYRQGLPALHYWGPPGRPSSGLRSVRASVAHALRREVHVDGASGTDEAMRDLVRVITRVRPHAIVAHTRALATFARWVCDRRARAWDDIVVIGSSARPDDRAALEGAFGPGVYETYADPATMLIAAECDAHDGLHVSEENLVVEIVRADGRPAGPGETGAVVVTDLHNAGMPLIRYANGDRATWSRARTCICGRGLRRVVRVERCLREQRASDAAAVPHPGDLPVAAEGA
jgi:phenylacetate-CoA ligase